MKRIFVIAVHYNYTETNKNIAFKTSQRKYYVGLSDHSLNRTEITKMAKLRICDTYKDAILYSEELKLKYKDRELCISSIFRTRKPKQAELIVKDSKLVRDSSDDEESSEEDVTKELANLNKDWRPIVEVLKTIFNPSWSWARNHECKYINLRVDMRDKYALLSNTSDKLITPDQLAYQLPCSWSENSKYDMEIVIKGTIPINDYPVMGYIEDIESNAKSVRYEQIKVNTECNNISPEA